MTLIEILIIIVIIVLSIIVIRISFTFNINEFLKERRKIKINQLKNICPHGTINSEDKNIFFESFFVSPPMTINYRCNQCGLIINSEIEANRICEQLNPKIIIKKQKKFVKKAKKLKLI